MAEPSQDKKLRGEMSPLMKIILGKVLEAWVPSEEEWDAYKEAVPERQGPTFRDRMRERPFFYPEPRQTAGVGVGQMPYNVDPGAPVSWILGSLFPMADPERVRR